MSRFLITADKGLIRICEKVGGRIVKTRSLRMECAAEEMRSEAVRMIRLLYGIIERRSDAGCCFGVDDVVADLRNIKPDECTNVDEDAPLRADLVSVGNGLKGEFRFVFPTEDVPRDFLLEYIGSLSQVAKNEGKDSRVRTYNSTRRSLSKFLHKGDIRFRNIGREFITEYSDWLGDEGVADSTQSFYLRSLRSILNQAKCDGLFSGDDNLFSGLNTRVVFKGVSTPPMALSREAMWKIAAMDLSDDKELEVVRDMFMFAFYCRGMELTDVINLTNDNLRDGILTYNRRGSGRVKSIIMDENVREIAERYMGTDSDYLFPIMRMYPGLKQYSVNGIVRRALKRIGELAAVQNLSFGMNISTWQSLISGMDAAEILRGSA